MENEKGTPLGLWLRFFQKISIESRYTLEEVHQKDYNKLKELEFDDMKRKVMDGLVEVLMEKNMFHRTSYSKMYSTVEGVKVEICTLTPKELDLLIKAALGDKPSQIEVRTWFNKDELAKIKARRGEV